jgi:S1-C subfamily serine protease
MKRTILAGVLVTAALVALVAWAPGALAAQDGRAVVVGPNVQSVQLFGSGSSIGVTVRDVNADDVSKAKLDGQRGVVIESVADGTPASRAGFRAGDIVLEYDGERVRSVMQFTRLVQETPSGRAVQAVVSREGSRQTLSVTPEQRGARPFYDALTMRERIVRPRDGGVVRVPEGGFGLNFDGLPEIRTLLSPRQLGATVTPLSEQLEGYFGVKNGVLVSAVESNSPASAAGLRAGDIITRINGRTVEGVNDVSEAVRNTAAGAQFEIVVTREKKELTLKAQLPERRPVSGGRGVAL